MTDAKCNSGNCNSGKCNSGDRNSGNCNSGNCNSGNCNSGNCNSGGCNSGDWNSGDWNSGYRNSGDWNSGDRNSGFLNTNRPKIRIFNKETDTKLSDIKFPDFFYFYLKDWVDSEDMSDSEKEEHPYFETTRGYLKTYKYKEAWKNSWDKTSEEDKRRVFELPNWDNEIFKEITGIDVEKELSIQEFTVPEVGPYPDHILIGDRKYILSKEEIEQC